MSDAMENMEQFIKIVEKYDNFSILPHYNPDPDALGSAYGLYYLLNKHFKKNSTIYFGGVIGRAENKMMIDVLDIPIVNLKDGELPPSPVILMDTQPGTGNNPLDKKSKALMIFDHHPLHKVSRQSAHADIRLDFGSTCTIVYDYFKYFKVKPTVSVATALYYGIQTDVVGEGRQANKVDFSAMEELSRYINRSKLYSIENPKLPFDYYIHFNKGLENSVIYDDFILSSLGEIKNPDYIGEIADFLIRFDRANYVLVMGIFNNTVQLSFRSQKRKINAGFTLKKIVGTLGTAGGHATNAGGRIIIQNHEDVPKISKKLIMKALNIILGKITSGVPLLSLGDYLQF